MTTYYTVEYEYVLPEHGTANLALPDDIDEVEQAILAEKQISQMYPDIEDLNILKIELLDANA